ncbi:hypothetical protein ACFO0S_06625 [Chryseomicrobium palamuruense]|uniref:DUF4025 domain-containing protein n=1 Tax=Chryseomicrobium palamuruense TaxID=682973 RepID=A0ABV8UWC9_9BACL
MKNEEKNKNKNKHQDREEFGYGYDVSGNDLSKMTQTKAPKYNNSEKNDHKNTDSK